MKHLRHEIRKDEVYEGDLVLHSATLGGLWGGKRGKRGGEKGVRRPTCKAQPVQGGCKEGARRVQGGCKEGARRVQGGGEYGSKGKWKSASAPRDHQEEEIKEDLNLSDTL